MSPPADVSVIMPAWNNAATIGRALASIAAQTVRPRQVVVVDDGSTDGTHVCAEAERTHLPGLELVLIRQDNQGAGAARNTALAAATSALVAFLDADDEWLPAKLEYSLEALAADPGLAFVSHDMMVADGVSERMMDCARHFEKAADPFVALMLRGFVATSTVVARRDAVLAAGGFNPALRAAQDYDLWLSLAESGRFRVFAGALTRYHTNPAGITSNVARRRLCSLAVLARHRNGLRSRSALTVAALRAAIIQYEATAAFHAQKQPIHAAIEVLRTPFTIATAWAGLPSPPP